MSCSVWFIIIQNTVRSVWFRIQGIIKKCPVYYSGYGSVFRVLFKIRPEASGSGFSVLLKNIQGIIQRLFHYSGYCSKYDLQRLVQDSAYYSKYELQRLVHYSGYHSKYDLPRLVQDSGYYSKMSRVLFSVWFIIQGFIQNTTCSVWFSIQGIIQNTTCRVWFIIQGILQNTTCSIWFRIQRII